MPDNIDQKELYNLLRESVKANTTNAESTKAIAKVSAELKNSMCKMNDEFVLHNLRQEDVAKDISIIRKQLLKWVLTSVIVIYTLLGGIVITKALGLDIVNLIRS
jgi:hypothetical protein